MTRELDALSARENVDASAVKRGAERVRMQRLPPFFVSLLVAVRAISCFRKSARLDEEPVFRGSIARHGDIAFAEAEVIVLPRARVEVMIS